MSIPWTHSYDVSKSYPILGIFIQTLSVTSSHINIYRTANYLLPATIFAIKEMIFDFVLTGSP